MNRSTIGFFHAMLLVAFAASPAQAQYPTLTEATQKEAAAKLRAVDERSDAAWAAAQPAIQEWAAKGKPCRPGAARPGDLPQADIPAFPGAQGGGMFSFGGRGGKVYVVTSLADRGPGTLREALEAGGPRIVVFNVAGIIRLKEKIRVRAPYVTLAGSTAPGDGVCIAGDTVELETHDVVIRHMRFRRGETWVGDRNDSIGGNPIGNIMIDHVSASWGLDENMSMYRHMHRPPGGDKELKLPTVNLTIQHSIFSECLNTYRHSFGSTIGGYNSTFHHNLWANNAGRNPSVGMIYDFTFVNNVLFNWVHRTVDGGDHRSFYTVQNNYFKPGPATPREAAVGFRFLKPESERSKTVFDNFGKAYVGGNVVEGNERVSQDNWDGGVQPDSRAPRAAVLGKIKVDQPYPHAWLEVQSAKDAYETVMANAGATLPKRDAVDARIIESVRAGKVATRRTGTEASDLANPAYNARAMAELLRLVDVGIITDIRQVGGYPDYKGAPYQDTDGDGMPDVWESTHGLNPKNATDAADDLNGDGYTNIEDFINGLDPRAPKRDWTKAPRTYVDRFAEVKL